MPLAIGPTQWPIVPGSDASGPRPPYDAHRAMARTSGSFDVSQLDAGSQAEQRPHRLAGSQRPVYVWFVSDLRRRPSTTRRTLRRPAAPRDQPGPAQRRAAIIHEGPHRVARRPSGGSFDAPPASYRAGHTPGDRNRAPQVTHGQPGLLTVSQPTQGGSRGYTRAVRWHQHRCRANAAVHQSPGGLAAASILIRMVWDEGSALDGPPAHGLRVRRSSAARLSAPSKPRSGICRSGGPSTRTWPRSMQAPGSMDRTCPRMRDRVRDDGSSADVRARALEAPNAGPMTPGALYACGRAPVACDRSLVSVSAR